MNPVISVVVPIFNVAPYLRDCLNSVCGQTLHEIEIICVDDCSTDGSNLILDEFAQRDERITIVKNKENMGLSASRNRGIEHAGAPFIMFVDADDMFDSQACEKMLRSILNNDSDVAICNIEMVYEAFQEYRASDEQYFANPFQGTFLTTRSVISKITNVAAVAKIYRTELLKRFNIRFPEGRLFESYPFWGEYSTVANRVTFIDDRLYKYRRRDGGIMANTFQKKNDSIDYVESIIQYYDWLVEHRFWSRYYWNFFRLLIFCVKSALHYAHDEKARDHIKQRVSEILKSVDFSSLDIPEEWRRVLLLLRENEYQMKVPLGRFMYSVSDLSGKGYYLFGKKILNIKFSEQIALRFFNVSILKISTKSNGQAFKLFGIFPVWYKCLSSRARNAKILKAIISFVPVKRLRKKIQREVLEGLTREARAIRLDSSNFSAFKFNDANLLREIKAINDFTYIPNPGNLGDCLIANATYQFFAKHGIKYHSVEDAPCENIVYGGGGIWVEGLYSESYKPILEAFRKAKRVVILPSGFCNCPDLINELDNRFVVFCRDRDSLEYLRSFNTGAKLYLDHDMAFRTDGVIFESIIEINAQKMDLVKRIYQELSELGRIAYLLRTDSEKKYPAATQFDLSSSFESQAMGVNDVKFASLLMLSSVDYFDAVVTDRLHIGIASALMGKEVFLLDNKYGKLSSVYENSLKECPNIHLCNNMPFRIECNSTATLNLLILKKELT